MIEAEVRLMHGHQLRNAGNFWKMEKVRKWISPTASGRNAAPLTYFRLLTSRTVR